MTRDEILAMKPGRELDALIKRHIFKTDVTADNYYKIGIGYYRVEPFSSDIGSAWEVVEKMKGKRNLAMNYTGIMYRVRFMLNFESLMDWVRNPNDRFTVWCEAMPEAICKSALLAVLEVD